MGEVLGERVVFRDWRLWIEEARFSQVSERLEGELSRVRILAMIIAQFTGGAHTNFSGGTNRSHRSSSNNSYLYYYLLQL